jgi:hypothetical protein
VLCCCGIRGPIHIVRADDLGGGEVKYYLQHQGWGWRGSIITTEKFNVGDTMVFIRKQDAPGVR